MPLPPSASNALIDQVAEQLAQLVMVGLDERQLLLEVHRDGDLAAVHLPLGQRDRVVQHLGDRRALDLQADRPDELEHLEDDRVGHLRLVDDVVEQRLRVGRVRDAPPQQAGHHLDARQRVLHLVRDGGRHLAERRQPVAQPLALLELLDAREVLEEQRRAARAARRRRGRATACSRSPCPDPLSRSSARFGRCWSSKAAREDAQDVRLVGAATSAYGRPIASAPRPEAEDAVAPPRSCTDEPAVARDGQHAVAHARAPAAGRSGRRPTAAIGIGRRGAGRAPSRSAAAARDAGRRRAPARSWRSVMSVLAAYRRCGRFQ